MNRRAATPARAAFWIALFAVMAAFGLSSLHIHAESAGSFFKKGEAAEARDDYDAAFTNFQKAFAQAPKELRYKEAFYRVRVIASATHVTKGRKLAQGGDLQGSLVEFLRAAEIDPGNEAAQQEIARVRRDQGEEVPTSDASVPVDAQKLQEIDTISGPVALKPVSNEPLTLHMTEDAKVVYQAVGKAAGVNVLFDPDLTSKRIQVDLNNVNLLDALRIVGTLSNTFWRTVTANTLFVASNTRQKHSDFDEGAVQTFYLSNAWQQNDLNDVTQTLRQVLPNAKVTAIASQNAIVMRGTPDELLLAQKLIDDLDKARPEVVVDIAVLEVSKNWERNLGLSWPSSASVAITTGTSTSSTTGTTGTTGTGSTTSSTSTVPTLYDLANLKASNFAVTIGSATANLLLTDSNTKILQNPRIRCTDSQKATMKIGERIPIATGSYSTGAGVSTALTGAVNTQFQYIDVGVNLEMTPTVHYDHDVTLKMKIEVSSESGSTTISGVTEPIIAQKTSEEVIRLREGEASVISGILNKQDQVSWNGVPGLSSIPGLKYLFGSKDHTITDDEIVFLLIPHIVRGQDLTPVNLRTIDTGVGNTSIDLRHVSGDGPAQPQAQPSAPMKNTPQPRASRPTPQIGTVPGQSAEAAAPAALAQMRAAADTSADATRATSLLPPASPRSQGVSFGFMPQAGPVPVGTTIQVPILLTGGTDIASVPLQIAYDPTKLDLMLDNITAGELLSRDGEAVAVVKRENGPGNLMLNVARPPGAPGITGTGAVCILSFRAKAAGTSSVTITRPGAISSTQQTLPATGATTTIQVK